MSIAAWLLAVGCGFALVWKYKSTAGAQAPAPARWPADSRIPHDADRPALVMLAHPHCPCTRASLGELAAIMSRFRGKIAATVLFMRPAGTPDGWEQSDTYRRAIEIPGVTVLVNADGREAARFGARVSGQTVLYDAAGSLRFHGGITSSRGHEGENEGRRRIVALLEGHTAPGESPVFGCALEDDETRTAANTAIGGPRP